MTMNIMMQGVREALAQVDDSDRAAFRALARDVHEGRLKDPRHVATRLAELGAPVEDFEAELAHLAELPKLAAYGEAVVDLPAALAEFERVNLRVARADALAEACMQELSDGEHVLLRPLVEAGRLAERRRAGLAGVSTWRVRWGAGTEALRRFEHVGAPEADRARLREMRARFREAERRLREARTFTVERAAAVPAQVRERYNEDLRTLASSASKHDLPRARAALEERFKADLAEAEQVARDAAARDELALEVARLRREHAAALLEAFAAELERELGASAGDLPKRVRAAAPGLEPLARSPVVVVPAEVARRVIEALRRGDLTAAESYAATGELPPAATAKES